MKKSEQLAKMVAELSEGQRQMLRRIAATTRAHLRAWHHNDPWTLAEPSDEQIAAAASRLGFHPEHVEMALSMEIA